MKTEWDLDVNVVTFVVSDQNIECQEDDYPVLFDLDANGDIVEMEIILPIQLDVLRRILNLRQIDKEIAETVLFIVGSGNMRVLMSGTPTIPQSPYVADPNEATVREFQEA